MRSILTIIWLAGLAVVIWTFPIMTTTARICSVAELALMFVWLIYEGLMYRCANYHDTIVMYGATGAGCNLPKDERPLLYDHFYKRRRKRGKRY